ncbi:beta-lactamase domain protein [Desulfofarcimen acetoxidans DSM 771]|jgi:glyoxylase-like metal-dependent hydrolase (beta-lactamase superfamily II)|uniref:Beta-lactamase domain protein n=1 Tax=Desulfofarcimen acetoxidans (strain ATCC 49208 / DSM 771 / KCTC 5769 / VKM B-1644 / 5575) TaxID=485916 RepID=C8W2T1_DESAS|nr:MBL fold metallo-hydrolase [Desulfofarcimen acetoxidans]ACV61087.1 beta-lactamase domain protein [Desulfofarcimen acetoxidans DSM 771]
MQVSEHVHALKIPFQVKLPSGVALDRFVYAYLIYGKEICLIDSGVTGAEELIFDYIKKTGRRPEEISLLVQTHAHPDHIGATRAIKNATGCKVAIHRAEVPWLEDVELQVKERPVPGFHNLVGGSAKVDLILEYGSVLKLDEVLHLEVIYSPGHSKGSVSLLLPKDKVLFSGDVVPLAGDMPIYDDVMALVSSVKRLKNEKFELLLAAWDEPRDSKQARGLMDEALHYLKRIDDAVVKVSGGEQAKVDEEFLKQVLAELGLPAAAANPLIARSFASHLKILERYYLPIQWF